MSNRAPIKMIPSKVVEEEIYKLGFIRDNYKGSHIRYEHPKTKIRISTNTSKKEITWFSVAYIADSLFKQGAILTKKVFTDAIRERMKYV